MTQDDLLSSFPWTYDQLQRYAVLRLLVKELGAKSAIGAPGRRDSDGNAGAEQRIRESRPLRILDVGGAAPDRPGTGFWLPAVKILASSGLPAGGSAIQNSQSAFYPQPVDPAGFARVWVADVSACREPGFLRASGTRLPCKTGAFDVVSAFDVLEHIPKEQRSDFLAEISRVASRAVLISCPTQSAGVEQAEAVLNSEMKNLYGTELGMLSEHRERGLPRAEEVDAALTGAGLAALSFGYGALSTWLAYLIFRSSFLLRAGSDPVTDAIDRYWTGQPQAAELSAPFYRRFWIGSKTIDRNDLARMEESMKVGLARGLRPILEGAESPVSRPVTDAFDEVERVARRILSRPFVSAVVVTMGEPALLGPCLDSILTQVVNFDLEVAVWNLNRQPDAAAWLNAHYPQVRQFEGNFSGLVEEMRGDFIFLFDEKLHPASDAVSRYVGMIGPEAPDTVLAVAAPWRGGFPNSWIGWARSVWKKSKGLSVKAGIVGDTSQIREDYEIVPKFKGWVIGDGLFFRRPAVFSRKNKKALDSQSIFLWEFE